MLHYRYIHLPRYYTRLLQLNLQSKGDFQLELKTAIWEDKGFHALVKRTFSDIDQNIRLDKIIKSVGWLGLRDRLAGAFLFYQENGYFPEGPKHDYVDDLLNFEKRLKPFTMDGHSRSFLLAFYLRMHQTKYGTQNKSEHTDDNEKLIIDEDIFGLFNFSLSRSVSIDWAYLIIEHFSSYLGQEIFKAHLKNETSYNDILAMLDEPRRDSFFNNLLAYGASINDHNAFYEEIVE